MGARSKDCFVVDSSFVLSFLLPDERQEKVDAVFNKLQAGELSLVSAELLPFEVLNGLKMAAVRQRISHIKASKLGGLFLNLPITLLEIDWLLCFHLAWQKKLSVYDASYLLLSRESHSRLLSLDSHLLPFSQKHSRSAVKKGN